MVAQRDALAAELAAIGETIGPGFDELFGLPATPVSERVAYVVRYLQRQGEALDAELAAMRGEAAPDGWEFAMSRDWRRVLPGGIVLRVSTCREPPARSRHRRPPHRPRRRLRAVRGRCDLRPLGDLMTPRYDCPLCGRRVKITWRDTLHSWGVDTETLVARHGPDADVCPASGRPPSDVTKEAALAARKEASCAE